jgi:hypothetical protein
MGASIGISDSTKAFFDSLKKEAEKRLDGKSSGVIISLSQDEFLNIVLVTYKTQVLKQ